MSRSGSFDAAERAARLDRLFSALAHPSRRQILLVVRFRGGKMTAGEIAERFHHSWPTTTRHLAVLQKAGLLKVRKVGRTRVYELNMRDLSEISRWLEWLDARKQRKK